MDIEHIDDQQWRAESVRNRIVIARVARARESLGAYAYTRTELEIIFFFLGRELDSFLCGNFRRDDHGLYRVDREEARYGYIVPVEKTVWRVMRDAEEPLAFAQILDRVKAELPQFNPGRWGWSLSRAVLAIVRCWERRGFLQRSGSRRAARYRPAAGIDATPKFSQP